VSSTDTAPLIVRDHARVRELRLNRVAARNAFNRVLFTALAEAITQADSDGAAAILLTAEEPVFSAGWDNAELANTDPVAYAAVSTAYRQMMTALESCPIPIVASVNGAAVGIGFTLLGHCDLVVIGSRARFRAPFAQLGLVPEAGSSSLLPRRIGPHLTSELLYTGRWMEADEAIASNLGAAPASPHKVDESALGLATEISCQPRESLVRIKQLLVEGRMLDATAARERESRHFQELRAQVRRVQP